VSKGGVQRLVTLFLALDNNGSQKCFALLLKIMTFLTLDTNKTPATLKSLTFFTSSQSKKFITKLVQVSCAAATQATDPR
jgi:hypothetical protein